MVAWIAQNQELATKQNQDTGYFNENTYQEREDLKQLEMLN
jgi:hypothetical protein